MLILVFFFLSSDILILPLAVLLYLSAYLDRGNLGNARLQGVQATVLNGSDTNYSVALSCFFITYILFSIPGTLLAKQINPSTSIAIGAAIWSVAATCQAATFNPASLYVCRLFVGVGEALFGQAMAFYLSIYYQKTELAKRVGLFISGTFCIFILLHRGRQTDGFLSHKSRCFIWSFWRINFVRSLVNDQH